MLLKQPTKHLKAYWKNYNKHFWQFKATSFSYRVRSRIAGSVVPPDDSQDQNTSIFMGQEIFLQTHVSPLALTKLITSTVTNDFTQLAEQALHTGIIQNFPEPLK